MWKALPESERKEYETRADEEQKRYLDECFNKYKSGGAGAGVGRCSGRPGCGAWRLAHASCIVRATRTTRPGSWWDAVLVAVIAL